MLSLPGDDSWWSERPGEEGEEDTGEQEAVSRVYRAHFLHTEHFNFVGSSDSGEEQDQLPLVASVKYYNDGHVR